MLVETLLGSMVVIGLAQLGVLGRLYRKVSTLETKMKPLWKQYTDTRTDGGRQPCPDLRQPGEEEK